MNSEDEEPHQPSEPPSGTSQPQTGHSVDQNVSAVPVFFSLLPFLSSTDLIFFSHNSSPQPASLQNEESPGVGRRMWAAARGREKPHGGGVGGGGIAQAHIGRGLLSLSLHAGAGLPQAAALGKQAPRSPRPAVDGGRGILSPFPPAAPAAAAAAALAGGSAQGETSGKNSPRGPRMPDGTRGFSMGRGKPMGPIGGAAT